MTVSLGKWVRTYREGAQAPLACIRVAHYLTREELAGALITALAPECLEDLRDLTKAEAEAAIREQLTRNAGAAHYWGDQYGDQADLNQDEVREWALAQVDHLTGK